ncbi:calcineurin-like phosphoesterase C-terminal domain-containing protein [Atrimonas thermophila]|uniref:calcineurin-like phosphoesterase C-terminal domain-containing protein n=1 Tax=Atrimonas thermophila TaxID=3064161 RepID=UPI00399CCD44
MQRRVGWWIVLVCVVVLWANLAGAQETFQGVVFEDANGNGTFDVGEKGIPGVCVSNGIEVVQTDATGRYTLPVRNEMVVFVIKPAEYTLPVNEKNIPQFFYVHRPNGSPDFIQEYKGFAPTGNLPVSVDFQLLPGQKTESFKMIAIGDTQVTDHREIGYLRDSLVKELQGVDASFALMLGDNVNDVLGLYDRYLTVMGEMGIPTFYVLGNHDMNYDSQNDAYSTETFTKKVMPPYYAFNVGKVHFVVLDSIIWDGKAYYGGISEEQLTFLKNDLAMVPAENLVVIAMHIPLISYMDRAAEKHQVKNREDLFKILEGRKVLFLAGHTHTLERLYPDTTIDGWSPNLPFPQIIAGAGCGSWWSGPKDEYGIPFSYQRDAAPKGYMIFEFQGNEWKETYKIYGRAIDDQLNISFFIADRVERRLKDPALPEGIFLKGDLLGVHVVANVFCDAVEVTCSIDNKETQAMTRRSLPDPMMNWYANDLPDWMRPVGSTHTFSAPLPSTLEAGFHTVTVTVKDRYGRIYQGKRLFEVW